MDSNLDPFYGFYFGLDPSGWVGFISFENKLMGLDLLKSIWKFGVWGFFKWPS